MIDMFHDFVKREGHGNVELMERRYCDGRGSRGDSSSSSGGGASKKKKRTDNCIAGERPAVVKEDGTKW